MESIFPSTSKKKNKQFDSLNISRKNISIESNFFIEHQCQVQEQQKQIASYSLSLLKLLGGFNLKKENIGRVQKRLRQKAYSQNLIEQNNKKISNRLSKELLMKQKNLKKSRSLIKNKNLIGDSLKIGKNKKYPKM